MILKVYVDHQCYPVNVAPDVLSEARPFFDRMDRDMDRGWQMSRDFVEKPNVLQRCQIAADRLLTALVNENPNMTLLMAGYILARMPGVTAVHVDTEGEIQNTELVMDEPQGSS